MSHFTVMVIGENVEEQLAPFQENNDGDCPKEYLEFDDRTDEVLADYEALNDEEKAKYPTLEKYVEEYAGHPAHEIDGETRYGCWDNPNSKWDWYQIGGRWSGLLRLKPGAEGEMGERSWANRDEKIKPGFCDSALKKDIDFDAMRQTAADEAAESWDEAHEIIGDRTWLTWEQVQSVITESDEAVDVWEKRRIFYNEQEALKAVRSKYDNPFMNLDKFLVPREEFVADARAAACTTFAFIKDGEWYERGEMGWFAAVANEKPRDEWSEQFARMIDELPEDVRVTIVDCHI